MRISSRDTQSLHESWLVNFRAVSMRVKALGEAADLDRRQVKTANQLMA